MPSPPQRPRVPRLFRAQLSEGWRRTMAASIVLLLIAGGVVSTRQTTGGVEVAATAPTVGPPTTSMPTTTVTPLAAALERTTTTTPPAPALHIPVTVPATALGAPPAPASPPPPLRPPRPSDPTGRGPHTVTSQCRGIHTLEVATGAVTQISGAPRAAFGPNVAPNGTSIAWAESQSRVLHVRGDGTVRTAAPTGANSVPTWSSDSRRLVWSRMTNAGAEAVVTDVEAGTELVVPNTQRMRTIFAASPTGEHIAYGGGDREGLRIARTDGTSDTEVPGAPEVRTPVWSPTGTMVAYADGNGVSTFDRTTGATRSMFTGAVAGGFTFAGEERLLVSTPSGIHVIDTTNGAVTGTIDGHGGPVWDGARRRVIFRRPANTPYGSVIEAALDGSEERTLFIERDAQVLGLHPSPRGDRIAFHCQVINAA